MIAADPATHAGCLPAEEVVEALADAWRSGCNGWEASAVEGIAERLSPYLTADVLDDLSGRHAYAEDDDTTDHTAEQKVDAYAAELRAVTRLALAARR